MKRVGATSSSFSKLLHRGDRITVVTEDLSGEIVGTIYARVVHAHRGRISARAINNVPVDSGRLYRRDEGRTWARGWDTPDAMVLEAEIALLTSR